MPLVIKKQTASNNLRLICSYSKLWPYLSENCMLLLKELQKIFLNWTRKGHFYTFTFSELPHLRASNFEHVPHFLHHLLSFIKNGNLKRAPMKLLIKIPWTNQIEERCSNSAFWSWSNISVFRPWFCGMLRHCVQLKFIRSFPTAQLYFLFERCPNLLKPAILQVGLVQEFFKCGGILQYVNCSMMAWALPIFGVRPENRTISGSLDWKLLAKVWASP